MERPWLKFYEKGVPHHIEYPRVPLYRVLDETARDFPALDAVIFRGKRIKYGELAGWARDLASALHEIGIKKGQRVAIMLPNCPQYIVAYYAILRLGGVVVNVNPMYVERELEFQLHDAEAQAIVALRDLLPRLESVKEKIPLKTMILTDLDEHVSATGRKAPAQGLGPGVYEYAELLEKGKTQVPPVVSVDPDEVALLQYTGGTTGFSKGAMLTHFNLVSDVVQCVSWNVGAQRGEERMLAVLPFFHVYGMTVTMNEAIYLAATIILLPRFQVDDCLEAIKQYQPTRFPGVPTMYIGIINHPRVKEYNISSIKVCSSGSAPLPVEALKKFEELTGGKISEGYGLTEASPVTHANPFSGKRKVGSIGLPRPDTDAKVVDLETGEKDLPPGEEGELCIRGPQVMKGYWNRPEETARSLRKGWLYTGDIAKMDEEGYFYIVDRKKDMIICGGFNVYPREVEEALYLHPKILEAAVLGVPEPYRGETVKAFVVLKAGQKATAEEIIEFCRQNLARFKVPTQVEFRQDLPKSHVGKVLRKVLREEEAKKESSHRPS
ncbi:MAG TPA: long-chain fatty acid--CoA ligase [Thermodesulfobacteriota bacterium]|nr:long-chain fatty acid--CoA ligase [Thermodesulfobacteriota bacterium]